MVLFLDRPHPPGKAGKGKGKGKGQGKGSKGSKAGAGGGKFCNHNVLTLVVNRYI